MKIEFNINNYVEFELTETGVKAMYEEDDNYRGYTWFVHKDYHEGQKVRMPMWKMISLFGNCTNIGYETFCKNAIIVLEVK